MSPGEPASSSAWTRPFRLAPGLRLRSWGESADLAYSPASGSTVLVEGVAGSILGAIANGQAGSTAAAVWAQVSPDEPSEAERSALLAQLSALREAGFLT